MRARPSTNCLDSGTEPKFKPNPLIFAPILVNCQDPYLREMNNPIRNPRTNARGDNKSPLASSRSSTTFMRNQRSKFFHPVFLGAERYGLLRRGSLDTISALIERAIPTKLARPLGNSASFDNLQSQLAMI